MGRPVLPEEGLANAAPGRVDEIDQLGQDRSDQKGFLPSVEMTGK
jgi:hypothetical protein